MARKRHTAEQIIRKLREAEVEPARAYRGYGYRRITALLQREGRQVNHKRVEPI